MPGSPSTTAHVESLLAAYHAGALSSDDAAQVAAHLRGCATCRGRSEQVAIDQIICSAPAPTVGPELRQRLYARIAAASEADASETPRATLRDARRVESRPLARPHGLRVAQRGWLSGVAAALLVALLVGMFWALPHLRQPLQRGQQQISKDATATALATDGCPASATSATLPANAVLNAMALITPQDGWAVGGVQNAQGQVTRGLIMRFSACHWSPIALDLPGVDLAYLSMDTPTDGWAAGNADISDGLILLHYSGGSWSMTPGPPSKGGVSALSMTSPEDGWLATMGPDIAQHGYTAGYVQRLWRYSQGAWTQVTAPVHMIDAIATVGPDDLWIAGSDFVGAGKQTSHSFAHYQHGQWTTVTQPAGMWARSLRAISPSDVWASGITIDAVPVVAHYDGATWRDAPEALPPDVNQKPGPGVSTALGDGEGWEYHQRAASGAAPGSIERQVVISGVLRETGGQWQRLNWPFTDVTQITVWTPVSASEVWAIGSTSVLQPPTPIPGGGYSIESVAHTYFLHYTNGVWTRYG